MNIQISNSSWISLGADKTGNYITACGTNGNVVEICNIENKYLKDLYKQLKKKYERGDT